MENQRVGAVVFSNPDKNNSIEYGSGWRAINDLESVQIESRIHLPTNIKWLSNIAIDFVQDTQMRGSSTMLDSRYLRTSVPSLFNELKLNETSTQEKAVVLAKIFDRTIAFCRKYFSLNTVPQYTLGQGIAEAIGHHQPDQSLDVLNAVHSATQTYVVCEQPLFSSEEYHFTSAVIPRATHCMNVLVFGLPFGRFKALSRAELPAVSQRVKWVCDSTFPMIVSITLKNISFKLMSLLNISTVSTKQHQLVTSLDIKYLSQVADIDIHDVFLAEEPVEQRYFSPPLTKKQALSISAGLALENYWTSLGRTSEGYWSCSPMTAWLHAADRQLCRDQAMRFSSAGFLVTGYGGGKVNLALERDQIQDYLALSTSMSLCPFMGVGKLSDESLMRDDSVLPDQTLSGLFAKGNLKAVLSIDQLASDEALGYSTNRMAQAVSLN